MDYYSSLKLLQLLIPIGLMTYAGYCWVTQSVHVRGKGWKTREEAPKAFYFTILLLLFIGIYSIGSFIFFQVR